MADIPVNDLRVDTIRVVDQSGQFVEYDLHSELRINEHNLQEDIQQQASKYVYWSSLLAQVRGFLEASELKVEEVKAKYYEPGREHYVTKGVAKPTKDQIESFIVLQPEYQEARQQLIAYQKHEQHLRYIVKAFEQRKDMLIQIGADLRQQRDYEQALKNI